MLMITPIEGAVFVGGMFGCVFASPFSTTTFPISTLAGGLTLEKFRTSFMNPAQRIIHEFTSGITHTLIFPLIRSRLGGVLRCGYVLARWFRFLLVEFAAPGLSSSSPSSPSPAGLLPSASLQDHQSSPPLLAIVVMMTLSLSWLC